MAGERESWGSRLGVVLAVAGSAVGLGNFLRFPVQAARNGGGAFMIPYFIAFLLLGIPLSWIEWTIGRIGGRYGHGTAPGALDAIVKRGWAKYLGVLGLMGPIIIMIYYTYIESWTLAYSVFSLIGKYSTATDQASMQQFLRGFQGVTKNQYFSSLAPALFFFTITLLLNLLIVYYGIRRGIERLCKIGMPVLLLFGIILLVRVITLRSPNPLVPNQNPTAGFGFLWNPNFERLRDARVWLAAAGQIFFTLSVGIGVILTYASYLRDTDDIPLSALSSASTNEFAEVILGGSIVIPAAFVFFGPGQIQSVAQSGAFNLGFVTMPLIFTKLPWGSLFGFLWFALLFIAGITSSISLLQPALAFLQDDYGFSRKKAVVVLGLFLFATALPNIIFLPHGFLDEFDFWGGTFALVLFGTVESIVFAWVLGMEKGWNEIHKGCSIRIPKIFKFIIKYITPAYLLVILGFWFYQSAIPTIFFKGVSKADIPYMLAARILIFGIVVIMIFMIHHAWKRRVKPLHTTIAEGNNVKINNTRPGGEKCE